MFFLFQLLLSTLTATSIPFKKCDYEKSGYFMILDRLTFEEAVNACISLGASLATAIPELYGLVETCSDWEFDTLEPWVARRLGDVDCPFVSKQYPKQDRIKLQDCKDEETKRPALCWQYPFAWITESEIDTRFSTLTDYKPRIASTVTTISSNDQVSRTSTFTWTSTETETMTKQVRKPHYLFDYDPLAGNVTLTSTITEFYTITSTVPAVIIEEEELAVAVHYETSWETSFTSTATVSSKCKN